MADRQLTALSADARRILQNLPPDGSPTGNIRLRASLHMPKGRYEAAKGELVVGGVVIRGIGRGGTLARLAALSAEELTLQRGVERESELYDRFAGWLRVNHFAPDEQTPFSHVEVTAAPSGHPSATGQWSRPDITAVQVTQFEYLPDREVEISTFEVKPAVDAQSLRSVYEAANTRRSAHFASLVVEVVEGGLIYNEDWLVGECARFHIGLYEIRGADMKLVREPERQSLAPREVDTRLRAFFVYLDNGKKDEYLQAIGMPKLPAG